MEQEDVPVLPPLPAEGGEDEDKGHGTARRGYKIASMWGANHRFQRTWHNFEIASTKTVKVSERWIRSILKSARLEGGRHLR
ncbi:hypothetical protein VTG60DRAFT_3231 [Thermothelomyces hinnuleus]